MIPEKPEHDLEMTPANRLKWLIDIMKRSSETNVNHFLHKHQTNFEFLNKLKFNEHGLPKEQHNLYAAIHVEYVFFALSAIESFHGSICAALEFNSENTDLNEVVSAIVNPGREKLQNARSQLSANEITDDDICRIASFANPKSANDHKAKLEQMMKPTFDWIRDLGRISVDYWDMFKPIRNVYAHNFRFIFYKALRSLVKKDYDNWVIGYIEKSRDLVEDSLLLGEPQRSAMCELGQMLRILERWVYDNIRYRVLNNDKHTLPKQLYFIDEKTRAEYDKIWSSQNYDTEYPLHKHEGPAVMTKQLELHIRLLNLRNKLGPPLRIFDNDGKETNPSSRYKL